MAWLMCQVNSSFCSVAYLVKVQVARLLSAGFYLTRCCIPRHSIKYIYILVALLLMTVILFYISRNKFTTKKYYPRNSILKKRYGIKDDATTGESLDEHCVIPKLNLTHDANKQAYHSMEPLTCLAERLFYLKDGMLFMNQSVLKGRRLQSCLYRGIERVNDDYAANTEEHMRTKPPFQLIVEHDFFHVSCNLDADEKASEIYSKGKEEHFQRGSHGLAAYNSNRKKEDSHETYNDWESDELYDNGRSDSDFDQLLVQVHPLPEVLQRIKAHKSRTEESQMNVLIFALDSMSHLCYERKLPKTYKFLKNDLRSFIFQGYNIVGDATTAALIPLLTGKMEGELPEVRKKEQDSKFVDVYPFIWKEYQQKGYVTLYAEDETDIGTFNFRFTGFNEQPTDHYMRPFWMRAVGSTVDDMSPKYCLGSKPNHQYSLDYTKDFFTKYRDVPKFAFTFHVELSHWDNNPVEYMDADIVEFLTFLRDDGHLRNTLLILMGDHGARYSNVRNTLQGRLEERLPMMSVTFPGWFLKKYPSAISNVARNAKHLSTPFDIHELLLDMLNISRLDNPVKPFDRGISPLRDIPVNRTCSSAGVDMHWCTCMHQVDIAVDNEKVQSAAGHLLHHVNQLTSGVRDRCVLLSLKRIMMASVIFPNKKILEGMNITEKDFVNPDIKNYFHVNFLNLQITVETAPNDALFEATVQLDTRTRMFRLFPAISRINLYGEESRCVQADYVDLSKYCYCKDYVKNKGSNGT